LTEMLGRASASACRQLDRDARSRFRVRVLADSRLQCLDRAAIRLEVTIRVRTGERRLAEHVERVAIAAVRALERVIERLGDRSPHHELVAHDAHGLAHCSTHDRLAHATDDPGHRPLRRGDVARVEADDPAGEHQPPRGSVHEQRLAVAEMTRPVAGLDLVRDQAIGRVVVRNAQQRLGKAHQDHAFLRREVVLAQECIESRLRSRRPPHGLHEPRRNRLHFRGVRVARVGRSRASAHHGFLVSEEVRVDRPAGRGQEVRVVCKQEAGRSCSAGQIGHGARTRSWCRRILAKRQRRRAPEQVR
jgi:hypothetical protein